MKRSSLRSASIAQAIICPLACQGREKRDEAAIALEGRRKRSMRRKPRRGDEPVLMLFFILASNWEKVQHARVMRREPVTSSLHGKKGLAQVTSASSQSVNS